MRKSIYAITYAIASAAASAIAAVFLLLLAGGCDTAAGPESGPDGAQGGKAAVSLVIAGAEGRTVAPAAGLGSVSAWKLWGGKTDGSPQRLLKEFTTSTGQTLYLEAGSWGFTLEGYQGPSLILRGTAPGQNIRPEGRHTLSFTVAPVLDGTGSVKITIKLPDDGYGINQVKVFRDNVDLNSPITPAGNNIVFEDTALAAGDYYFSFRLYKADDSDPVPELYGTVSELVRVRQNLSSEKTYTLGPADLNIRYVINYHLNGGKFADDVSNPGSYRSTDAGPLPEPTRTGCDFDGWYTDGGFGGGAVTEISTLSPGDKDFYAQWTVTNATDVVDEATSGNTITLTGVAWSDIKSALESALSGGGITTLDLSGVSGLTEWADNTLSSNKDKITSMVLPDTVKTLPANEINDHVFRGYASLVSVSGAGVTDIGKNAFYSRSNLVEVNFPAATDIGESAFQGCTKLTKVDFPAAETIGDDAFQGAGLIEVNLPVVTSIGYRAFGQCNALTDLYLPTSGSSWPPTLAANVFQNTGSSGTLSIHVGSANAVTAYTSLISGWGVSAETNAEVTDTTGKYGDNHKAIKITE
jgi:uncharacterized repeat protein (TIGR02543 family)